MQSERLIREFVDERSSEQARIETTPINKPLSVKGLCKSFGGKMVLKNISFSVVEGESVVLLGASGSGKTTVLRILAGLDAPDSGRVLLRGKDVTRLPAKERNVGLIFQNYALFPRMTAEENISFGLRIRGASRKEIRSVVHKLIALVKLEDHRKKRPSQLSGGQQQRVAIARALAYNPQVLLFDEPFAALDSNTRLSVRQEVVALLKKQNVPAIFITHDREEALAIGDRIAVLNDGVLEQIGSPREIYDYPETEYVAGFIGAVNTIPGVVRGAAVEVCGGMLPAYRETKGFAEGQRVKIVFRPEDVCLRKDGTLIGTERKLGSGTVIETKFAGFCEHVEVMLEGSAIHPDGFRITINRNRAEAARAPLLSQDRVTVSLGSFRLISGQ